jgi:hypothetical protein
MRVLRQSGRCGVSKRVDTVEKLDCVTFGLSGRDQKCSSDDPQLFMARVIGAAVGDNPFVQLTKQSFSTELLFVHRSSEAAYIGILGAQSVEQAQVRRWLQMRIRFYASIELVPL